MGTLEGRVAVVTGAARGIGREHSLLLAAEGAMVVANDLGSSSADGERGPIDDVVDEICAGGGRAVANHDDVSDADGAQAMIRQAIDTFGDLHVLVNNAGILRDHAIVKMTAEDWDVVVKVHLAGHFHPTRWAAKHWRERAKAGAVVDRSIIHTTSTAGLFGSFGQANYAAAKAGIAALSSVCQLELASYGVRSNAIAPAARTRLTLGMPHMVDLFAEPDDPGAFDVYHPGNVAPLVAALAMASCPIGGRLFYVRGGLVSLMQPWSFHTSVSLDRRWDVAELAEALGPLGSVEHDPAWPAAPAVGPAASQ